MARGNAARDETDRPPLAAVDHDVDDDSQAGDPVRVAMGELDDLDVDDLDELDDEVPDYLPEGFDLFQISDDVVESFREKGRDPTLVKLMIHPVRVGGKHGKWMRAPAIKTIRPAGVTYARLCRVLPPGRYDAVGYAESGKFVGSRRFRVGPDNADSFEEAFDELDGARRTSSSSSSRSNLGERLLYTLAVSALKGRDAEGRGGEMREAMAGMVKLMTAQATLQQTEMANRLRMMEEDRRAEKHATGGQVGLLKTFVDLLERRAPKPARTNAGGKFEDFVAAMQLGHHFANMQQKGEPADGDELRKWVLPLVDSLGPGVLGAFAMMLPQDKAKMLSDLIEQHLKTREAEAGSGNGEDDPEIVEGFGEEVHRE